MSFNLGKAVKKWKMQGASIEEIAKILGKSTDDCILAYKKFKGYVPTPNFKELKSLILKKEKIHLYGDNGTGKSYSVKNICSEINHTPFFSYAMTEEELVRDWGEGPFIDENNLFVMEGDSYRWKKYGLIKHYIEKSKAPIIVITNGKDTPTKNITKLLTQVKMFPPTRTEIATWLKEIDDDYLNIEIEKIYDKDWRKVIRNYSTNLKETKKNTTKEYLEAKQVVYKLLKGNCTIEDIDNCIHPISFVLNWFGWNLTRFYEGKELKQNYDLISFLDSVKYSTSKKFLKHILLQILPSNKKEMLQFPPYKRYKKKEEVEIKDYVIEKTKLKSKQETTISDFLLI